MNTKDIKRNARKLFQKAFNKKSGVHKNKKKELNRQKAKEDLKKRKKEF